MVSPVMNKLFYYSTRYCLLIIRKKNFDRNFLIIIGYQIVTTVIFEQT